MPARRKTRSTSKRAPATARPGHGQRDTADQFALLGVASALSLVDREQDVARLTASAVSSALAVPLGLMVLRDDDGARTHCEGRLGGKPMDAALLDELRDYVAALAAAADAPATMSTTEVVVTDAALPAVAASGIERLLFAPLRTVEGDFRRPRRWRALRRALRPRTARHPGDARRPRHDHHPPHPRRRRERPLGRAGPAPQRDDAHRRLRP